MRSFLENLGGIGLPLCMALIFSWSNSAPATEFGFNEEFITELAYSEGFTCPECSTNVAPIPINTTTAILDELAHSRVRVNREILPLALLADGRSSGWIAQLLKQYMDHHIAVILAMGLPMPPSLSVTGNGAYIIPMEDPGNKLWQTQSQRIAGLLTKRLAAAVGQVNQPGIAGWMRSNLTIEPFNEFDGLGGFCAKCATKADRTHIAGTPERGKILTDTIRSNMISAHLGGSVSTPSIVNVYKGRPAHYVMYLTGSFKYGPFMAWLGEYYDLKGKGDPNIHLYFGRFDPTKPLPSVDYVLSDRYAGLETGLRSIQHVIPPQYRNSILVTEAGFGRAGGSCTPDKGGVPPDFRVSVYQAIVRSPVLRSGKVFLFWRLLRLEQAAFADRVGTQRQFKHAPLPNLPKPQLQAWIATNLLGCEPAFGVMDLSPTGKSALRPAFSAVAKGASARRPRSSSTP